MTRVYLFVPVLLVCAIVFAAADRLTSHTATATPLHVTSVFFDGVNHGDYRQSCQVWEAARKHATTCEAALTVQLGESAMMGEFGGYRVVPRSVKEWRTGRTEYANVQVVYAPTGGQKLTVHLRKRPGGPWRVWYVA